MGPTARSAARLVLDAFLVLLVLLVLLGLLVLL
jgi:hypothetical protein